MKEMESRRKGEILRYSIIQTTGIVNRTKKVTGSKCKVQIEFIQFVRE